MKGKLMVVATPIGNLEDITLRAIRSLKEAIFILCEDTRESGKLMKKYEIKTPLISYRDQNHERIMPKVLEKLNMGLDLALISDAGTPTISDPGYRLVNQLRTLGYNIEAIPGASGVTAALSVSGLPTDRFLFLGFLPKSDSHRLKALKDCQDLDATLCIYESPNRLFKLLQEIYSSLGNRKVCVINDITKKFEKVDTLGIVDMILLYEQILPKGEYIVLVAKK